MTILRLSLSASLMIIVILLIRAILLNKLPKGTFKILWILAMVKLICSVSIPFRYSLSSLFDDFNPVKYVDSGIVKNNSYLYENIHYNNFNEYSTHIITSDIKGHSMNCFVANLDVFLLAIGVLLLLFVGAVYLKYCIRFNDSKVFENELCDEILEKENLRRKVVVKTTNNIKSPLTYGIIKPVILLPTNIIKYSNEELEFILLHELTHIKNFDQLYKIFLILILCIHWFNPLVWIMCFVANKDIELLCDASVVMKTHNLRKREYAYMLITMADNKNKQAMVMSCFSNLGFEERIRSIMLSKKFKLKHFIAGASIVLTVIALFFTVQNDKIRLESPKVEGAEVGLKEVTPYMNVTATVEENKTLMDIKLLKDSVCVTGREYWEKGEVIKLKISTDVGNTLLQAGIIPAEKMEEGWKYDDYRAPITKEVSAKESTLEFIVPETGEYGIFIQDFYSKLHKIYLRSGINIQLEVNKEFKNPLNKD
ncbi:MAG: M56 family metallopeptidase [Peptostreptococcaceae bacterium]|nr:M56 family metallopeptidase [Peptostreptococcaceae bacterium]